MSQIFTRFLFFAQNALLMSLLVSFLCGFNAKAQTQSVPTAIQSSADPAAKKPGSPSNTVQDFYKAMRERRFRDALMMTNLRPAVEKLTAEQLADLAPDFEPMATRVPEKIELSGEQISGNLASVFVKSDNSLTNKPQLDELKLRRENNDWIILTGEAETETEVKREGANFFFKQRIEARHSEIELTFQDIMKAEFGYALQHNGVYADLQTLVNENLVSADVMNPDLMGYRFRLQLTSDKKKYMVNAEPVQYGKTGKLSFLLNGGDAKTGPLVQKDDKNGSPLQPKN
ncbi:MAG: hypothetical protein ABI954_09265 [Pyrinomonadaceae bacterium]